jgi:hypothetical protein
VGRQSEVRRVGIVDLTPQELRELEGALLRGLPSHQDFERFARLHLGVSLAEVSGKGRLPDMELDLT